MLAIYDDGGAHTTIHPEIDSKNSKIDPPMEIGDSPEFLASDGTGKVYINLEDKGVVGHPVPRVGSGFRLRAPTPARRLKFESHRRDYLHQIPRVGSGFRLRAPTPARRLKFDGRIDRVDGGYSSAAERLTVAQDVVGSIPTSRPKFESITYEISSLPACNNVQ